MTDAQEFRGRINEHLHEIVDFVKTNEFQELLTELWEVPQDERKEFVRNVILDERELAKRGIDIPEDLIIQRSAFADNRPTLFCVTKKLGGRKKVTFTFDNEPSPLEAEGFAAGTSRPGA